MPSTLTRAAAALGLMALFAAPVPALDLFGPDCLEMLGERTRAWAECKRLFDAADARCKLPKARMHESMRACTAKGRSKAEIDAAMAKGYREAGTRPASSKSASAQPATASSATQREDERRRTTTPGFLQRAPTKD